MNEARKVRIFLLVSMLVCATGIVVVNYFTNAPMEKYIMPVILYVLAMIMFATRTKEEKLQTNN